MAAEAPASIVELQNGTDVAQIFLHGATVTSWKSRGREVLFLSSETDTSGALLAKRKALRGGIPVVFPQFGPGPIQQHGFARNVEWKLRSCAQGDSERAVASKAVLELTESEYTLAMWPHAFRLQLDVELTPGKLSMTLNVTNTGSESFSFTSLLHTYFRVDDIARVRVSGVEGRSFRDKTRDMATATMGADEPLTVAGETDRVFDGCAGPFEITDGQASKVVVATEGFKDVVMWNPWTEKAKAMADFGDNEYNSMICVEAGTVAQAETLAPQATWSGGQTLRLVPASSSL